MEVLMGKSSVNGQFSMAMLNNQRVYINVQVSIIKYIGKYVLVISPILIGTLIIMFNHDREHHHF
jgi:hypothetical protein